MKIRLDYSDSSLRKGHILDQKYSIKKILGIGGFGRTYLAESIWTQENFAIKEYFPNDWAVRSEDGISLRAFDETKRSFYEHGLSVFVNEAKILKNLREDDVVVDVKDFFYENNTGYIVMEYIQGCTLAQYMQKQNSIIPLDMAEVIIISVAKSMSKIHRLGLLHRDISPDNIMLLEDGSIKLIDFGATRQYALNETTDMSVMIKPGFAPMEQYSRTGKQGPWTDVYALAATYYFIVSGKRPLTAVDRCAGEQQLSLSSVNGNVPEELSEVIDCALELDYSVRIQNMEEFVREFETAYRGSADIPVDVYPHITMKMHGKTRKWKFMPDKCVTIGRSINDCDICVEEGDVSRIHCKVMYDAISNQFKILDLSKNGTYTQNGLIGRDRSAILNTGDVFWLVDEQIKFYLEVR